jgi:hypothetical protein
VLGALHGRVEQLPGIHQRLNNEFAADRHNL